MESLHSQADLGMRTADFFNGSSSDGEEDIAEFLDREASGVEANLINRGRHSQFKRRASQPLTTPNELSATHCQSRGRSIRPEGDGYQALSPVKTPGEHTRYVERPETPSTGMSFNGSITELLPDEQGSSPPVYPRPARLSDFSRPHSMTIEPRSEPAYRSSSVMPTAVPVVNTVDQILSAHAIAHEITLQSLMKDRNMDAFGPNGDRGPRIPTPLLFGDPRSPGIPRKFSAPEENQQTPAASRKVHVLPPPIDTARSRPLIPHHFLRTPYPEEGTVVRHKNLSYMTEGVPDATTPASNSESLLTLSIRPSKPNTRRRVTSIVIPASTTHHISSSSQKPNRKTNSPRPKHQHQQPRLRRPRILPRPPKILRPPLGPLALSQRPQPKPNHRLRTRQSSRGFPLRLASLPPQPARTGFQRPARHLWRRQDPGALSEASDGQVAVRVFALGA
jgi:hypothetical protein